MTDTPEDPTPITPPTPARPDGPGADRPQDARQDAASTSAPDDSAPGPAGGTQPSPTATRQDQQTTAAADAGPDETGHDDTLRQKAWTQQQQAANEYRQEAGNYGYPGVWPAGMQPPSRPGFQPGTAAGTGFPQPAYRRGPKLSMIVWGVILLCIGLFGVAKLVMPVAWLTQDIGIIMIACFLALLGVVLIISAIVSAFSKGPKGAKPQ